MPLPNECTMSDLRLKEKAEDVGLMVRAFRNGKNTKTLFVYDGDERLLGPITADKIHVFLQGVALGMSRK